jgi:hypothetical protein
MDRRHALIFGTTLLVLVGFPNDGFSQAKSLKEQLVGTWLYVSSTGTREDGTPVERPKAHGAVTYAADGQFHFITARSDAPRSRASFA